MSGIKSRRNICRQNAAERQKHRDEMHIYTKNVALHVIKCFQKGFICSDFLHNT
mgnify:CR=1 FL=1